MAPPTNDHQRPISGNWAPSDQPGGEAGIAPATEPATAQAYVVPDIDGVRQALSYWPRWEGSGDPERAWDNAVSGDTAARMRHGNDEVTQWECTAQIIAKAAAYGWWPQETPDGDYIAVPIDRWVAEGHPYSRIVPNLDAMLDRWNITPVVIDPAADPGPDHTAPRIAWTHEIHNGLS